MLASVLFTFASGRNVTLGNADGGLSYNPNCGIAFGFDFEKIGSEGECGAPAVKIPKPCKELGDNPNQEACVGMRNANSIQNYYHKVTSSSSAKSLLSTAVSAEGGGWGVSISASVGFQSAHQSSSNSVAWYLGSGGSLFTNEVQYIENLELEDGPLYLLKTSQFEKFLKNHGTHYIYKIDYGGSFIGNVEIQSSMSSDSMAIDVAASMSYGEGPFSVSGSAKFHDQMSKMTQTTTQTQWMSYEGGTTEFHPLNTTKMADSYHEWWKNVQKPNEAKPLVMYFRSYYDLQTVSYYVDKTASSAIAAIFQAGQPSPTVINYLTKEYAMTKMALNSVQHAKNFHCVAWSSSFMKKVQNLEIEVAAHKDNIERIDMATIAELDINIGLQNMTFFKAYLGVYDDKLRTLLDSNRACSPCEMKSTGMWGATEKSIKTVDGYFGCKAHCEKEPQCVVFAWWDTKKYDQCYLKSHWYPAHKQQSPSVVGSVGPKHCRCFEYNIDYFYGDLDTPQIKDIASPEACQKQCQENGQCETWTWVSDAPNANQCFLKRASGYTKEVMHGHVSGPKYCPYPLDMVPN